MVKKAVLIGINFILEPKVSCWAAPMTSSGRTNNYTFCFISTGILLFQNQNMLLSWQFNSEKQTFDINRTKYCKKKLKLFYLLWEFDLCSLGSVDFLIKVPSCSCSCVWVLVLFSDDDIRETVSKVPKDCSFTFVPDSCHSGGLIDSAKEQIGESFKKKPKTIWISWMMKTIWNARWRHQWRARKRAMQGQSNGGFGNNGGILLSGCQTDQVSADVGSKEKAFGAFTNSIQIILAETKGEISYRELVLKSRKLLEEQGYRQRPGLYCSDSYVNAPFICWKENIHVYNFLFKGFGVWCWTKYLCD